MFVWILGFKGFRVSAPLEFTRSAILGLDLML